ncbi:hypothetical protein J6184_001945 [Salmonella enterica subsp. enterica serovar Monschaui]|nr:hypothetical protein [Salmonella enterica subsp. enterica serovar Monschaui]
MFPAPAGINRLDFEPAGELDSVPRASGDKPAQQIITITLTECSPRQRG